MSGIPVLYETGISPNMVKDAARGSVSESCFCCTWAVDGLTEYRKTDRNMHASFMVAEIGRLLTFMIRFFG